MTEYHILSLGAGVQSTALYLLSMRGELGVPKFDFVIFADTQEEPEAVYRHLEWLQSLGGPKINIRSVGRLGDDLKKGRPRSTEGENTGVASIPVFTKELDGDVGKSKRQCTKEYKTEVVERFIRREVLKLAPKKRIPKDVIVHQYIGMSADETGRMIRVKARIEENSWQRPHFPLWENNWHRQYVRDWLKDKVPHETPRSACVFCPYKRDSEWRRLRDTDPVGWARAIEIDNALRAEAFAAARMKSQLYLHRSCIPLAEAPINEIDDGQQELAWQHPMAAECEGMCGL